jgi:hypothetical protein
VTQLTFFFFEAPSSVSPRCPRYFRALLTRLSSDYYGILPTFAPTTFFVCAGSSRCHRRRISFYLHSAILLLIVLVRRIRDAAPETHALQQAETVSIRCGIHQQRSQTTTCIRGAHEDGFRAEDGDCGAQRGGRGAHSRSGSKSRSFGYASCRYCTIGTAVSGPVVVPATSGNAGNVSQNEVNLEMYPLQPIIRELERDS